MHEILKKARRTKSVQTNLDSRPNCSKSTPQDVSAVSFYCQTGKKSINTRYLGMLPTQVTGANHFLFMQIRQFVLAISKLAISNCNTSCQSFFKNYLSDGIIGSMYHAHFLFHLDAHNIIDM